MEPESNFNPSLAETHKMLLYKAMEVAIDNLGTSLASNKPDKKDELIDLFKVFPNASNKAKVVERFALIAATPRNPDNVYGVNRSFNAFLYYFRDKGQQQNLARHFLAQVVTSPLNHQVENNGALLTRNHKPFQSKEWIEKAMARVIAHVEHQSSSDVRNKKQTLSTLLRLFTTATNILEQKNFLRLFYYTVGKNSPDPGYSHNQRLDLFYKMLSERRDLFSIVREIQKDILVVRANRRPWIELKPKDLVAQFIPKVEYKITQLLDEIEQLCHKCPHSGKRKSLEENYKAAQKISLNTQTKLDEKHALLKNHFMHCREIVSARHFGTFFKATAKDKRDQIQGIRPKIE